MARSTDRNVDGGFAERFVQKATEAKLWVEGKAQAAKVGLEQTFASKHKELASLFEEADKEVEKNADRFGTGPAARAEAFQQALSARLYAMISGIEQNITHFDDNQRTNLRLSQQNFVATITSSALDLTRSVVYDRVVADNPRKAIDFSQIRSRQLSGENIAKLNVAAAPLLLQFNPENRDDATSYSHLQETHQAAYVVIERTRLRAKVINLQHEVDKADTTVRDLITSLNQPEWLRKRWTESAADFALQEVSAKGIYDIKEKCTTILGDNSKLTQHNVAQQTLGALNRITPEQHAALIRNMASSVAARLVLNPVINDLDHAKLTLFPANPAELSEDYAVLRNARETIQEQTYGDKDSQARQLQIIDNAMCMNLLLQREVSWQKELSARSHINAMFGRDKLWLQAGLDAEERSKRILMEYLLATPILGKFTSARQSERLVAGLVGTFVGLTAAAGAWAATASIPALCMQGGGVAAAEAAAWEAFTNPASVWKRLSGLLASNQPIAGISSSLFVQLVVVGSIVGAAVFTAAITQFAHDIEQGKQSGKLWGDVGANMQVARLQNVCENVKKQYTELYNDAQGSAPVRS